MFKRSKEPEKKGSEKREDLLVSFLKDAHFVFAIIHIGLFRLSDGFYLRLVRSLPFRGLAEAVAATEKRTAMRQSVFAKRLYVYGFIRNTYI